MVGDHCHRSRGGGVLFHAAAKGAVSLASNDLVFAGGVVLRSGGTLDLNGVIVDQGWTTAGQAVQGMCFESPSRA